jgi:hypothetical protein
LGISLTGPKAKKEVETWTREIRRNQLAQKVMGPGGHSFPDLEVSLKLPNPFWQSGKTGDNVLVCPQQPIGLHAACRAEPIIHRHGDCAQYEARLRVERRPSWLGYRTDMQGRQSELDFETEHAVVEELRDQAKRAFAQGVSTAHKLIQHNFLVNAGGAAAVLAYMGSDQGADFAILPLACFLVGVIATGIELQCLLNFFGDLHDDATRRWLDFAKGKSDLSDAAPSPDLGRPTRLHRSSELVAQWAFPIGVALGLVAYLFDDLALSQLCLR